jgi:hypothetical protein
MGCGPLLASCQSVDTGHLMQEYDCSNACGGGARRVMALALPSAVTRVTNGSCTRKVRFRKVA